MSQTIAIGVLLLAAVLEAGGDALVRWGLRTPAPAIRIALFLAGAVVLFGYGYTVNAPSWSFGRVLGIYIVFFFVVAQLVSWIAFRQPPTTSLLIGGAFIVVGGIIIASRP
jgi:drug/metabolite transporter (DMT)-like permease